MQKCRRTSKNLGIHCFDTKKNADDYFEIYGAKPPVDIGRVYMNELKKGLYGIYYEVEYRITVDMNNNLKIMTDKKEKTDSTFEDTYQSGVYTKIVKPNELVDCVSVIPFGIIKGEKVQILQEKENKYQVATGALLVGSNLNLPRIDRDSWLGWVSKSEVTLIEEITPINPEDL